MDTKVDTDIYLRQGQIKKKITKETTVWSKWQKHIHDKKL